MRIGHGFDVHAFDEGDFIMVGGVKIPYHRGIRAHSDGDVALHALCDALLGAIGEGDIGVHFPDTDPSWRHADSRIFLRHVTGLVHDRELEVSNADVTIVTQSPRLRPFMDQMRANIASDLQVETSQVNVKATTTEGLGFSGRAEGIAAFAVVMLLSR